jgi:hypothetical protein
MSSTRDRLVIPAIVCALIAALVFTGAAAASGWVTFRIDGVRVRHPADWSATARQLTPVTSPRQLLAVASFPFSENPRSNGCRPAGTLREKQPAGVVLFVIEYGEDNPSAFPRRPNEFRLRAFGNYECYGRSYQVRFREAGRYFQVFVSFGREASRSTRAAALRVLNSFTARPR